MAKPWARIEVGYMRHPKFLALNANAICLWHEGKGYCDEHLTDGLIPKDALKTFRFAGKKAIAMLLTAYGQKPDGAPYAALWEPHPIGYKMHDYLEHNDSREKALARIEQSEESRAVDRERLQRWREAKRLKRHRETPSETVSETPTETLYTESETESETRKKKEIPPNPPRMDQWARDLVNLYPPQGRCGWNLVERPLFDALMSLPDGPQIAWTWLQVRLEQHTRSHQWRVKGMIPRLDKWLREGLYLQELPESAPASEQASAKTLRMLEGV